MKTFMFMYILTDDIAKVQANLGQHISYWKKLGLDNYRNGPFADKSGGMILFSAGDFSRAEKIIASDPLLQGKAVRQYWLKEWVT